MKLANHVRVSLLASPEIDTDSISEPQVSPWLYFAGLAVAMCGMYVATYDLTDLNTILLLRGLLTAGFFVSYWMRRKGIDIRQYQGPALVVFATVMYFVATSGPDLGGGTQAVARPYQVQTLIIWIAILQSFALCTDGAVVFAIVPSLALLGIMGSATADDEIRYTFFVFILSSTFLMVHQNYLEHQRRLHVRVPARSVPDSGKLFRGEILLVGICFLATVLIANVVAAPLQIVGKALLPINPSEALRERLRQNQPNSQMRVDEQNRIDLATGPRTQSDTELMVVQASAPITYLRGMTYDFYAGNRFEDHMPVAQPVDAENGGQGNPPQAVPRSGTPDFNYTFDPNRVEVGNGRMDGSTEVTTSVKILSGMMTHFYAPPVVRRLKNPYFTILRSRAGGMFVDTSIVQGAQYSSISLMPTADPAALRQANDTPPNVVVSRYLQLPRERSPRIQQFVDDNTRGKSSVYDRVMALRDALAHQCAYNLQAPAAPRDKDAVETFLFETRQGYCDSYSAGLAVLCRYAGIPARMATGFLAGDRQNDGSYLVRERHKHAWTEVYFTNVGWVAFDGTDGARDATQAANTSNNSRSGIIKWFVNQGPIALMLLTVFIVALGYLINNELLPRFKNRSRRTSQYVSLEPRSMEIVKIYTKATAELARRGYLRQPSQTPLEFATFVQINVKDNDKLGAALSELTGMLERFSYGFALPSDGDVIRARQLASDISSALPISRVKSAT